MSRVFDDVVEKAFAADAVARKVNAALERAANGKGRALLLYECCVSTLAEELNVKLSRRTTELGLSVTFSVEK